MVPDKTALVAISRHGSRLARRLQQGLPGAELFLPGQSESGVEPGVQRRQGRAGELMAQLFARYRELVIFGSVGMAVRLVAPLASDKHTDPAVVVVDDAGRFAVSLLSGHLGGANALAARVAEILGAQPVITTASDVLGTPAVDLLGREFGWRLEGHEQVTRVSAAVVNGETVGLVQETGEREWWPREKPLPPGLLRLGSLEELAHADCQAAIIISDRLLPVQAKLLAPHVVLRPRSLVAGIGCNRGTTREEIEEAIEAALVGHGLSTASLARIGTVDLKSDEPGLRQVTEGLGIELMLFSPRELDGVDGLPNPSTVVQGWIGSRGVCEPAALLASAGGELLVPKQKTKNVTVAVARRAFTAVTEDR